MGTRHLIAAKIDGAYKIAQYGQWDGYPSGQGVDVLDFLRGMERSAFLQKLRAASWINPTELKKMWEDAGADPKTGLIDHAKAKAFSKAHPEFSRDTGADILDLVANAPAGIRLDNSIDFAKDSLFCEFAYVIDFDAETFEVFKGFSKEPPVEGARFTGEGKQASNETYYPVRLLKSYPLSVLPTKEQFLRDCEEREEE